MADSLAPGIPARAHRALDSLHSLIYFAPEADEELARTGLRPGRMTYFASRSAPMGPVPAAVTAATFYNFNPDLVARYIPRAWTLATPDAILAARLRAADRALRRVLGDEAPAAPAVAELAELTRVATDGLSTDGRPLFAGHAALEWPEEPHLALWHGITLLREYRGDGHTAALLSAELSGVEALVTHTATGRGFTVEMAKASRGWSDDQWAVAEDALHVRGLMSGSGLTADGEALRGRVESETDRLASVPWLRLGSERTDRLIGLGKALSREAVAAGAFPAEVFARG